MRIELMFLDHILTKKLDQLLNHNGSYTPSQNQTAGEELLPQQKGEADSIASSASRQEN